MLLTHQFSLAILWLILGAQIISRSLLVRYQRVIIAAAISGIFFLVALDMFLQYHLWQTSPVSRYLLPPYQGIGYYFEYVMSRFAGPWLLALGAAILFGASAHFFNHKFDEHFFEKEEPFIIGLGAFLSGYPGFLLYLGMALAAGTLLSFFYALSSRGRAPLYYIWIPSAISAILIENWFIPQKILVQFNL